MAKAWYHWTANAILVMLLAGYITIDNIPIYECPVGNVQKHCMFLKDNNITCAEPVPTDSGWSWKGIKCGNNPAIAQWEQINEGKEVNLKYTGTCTNINGEEVRIRNKASLIEDRINITAEKRVIFTNAKIIEKNNINYVIGECVAKLT